MTRPLSICFVSQEFPPHTNWGGIAVHYGNLARVYACAGHRVVVISRASPGAPSREVLPSGAEVWRVGVPMQRKLVTGRTLDRILHARSVATHVMSLDAAHHFDVIEAPEASLDGEVLVRYDIFERRMVIQCHGSNVFGQSVGGLLAPLHRLDWAWSRRREQAVLRRVRTIVVSSEATRQVVLGQGVHPSTLHMVRQGIDTSRFCPAVDRPRRGPLEVGFVGRLQQAKGIDFVWRVMERLGPDAGVRFHFKGVLHRTSRQDTMARLRRCASFAQYHPPGGNDDMPDFYRSLDVLLLPSRFENFGLAYVEAMATELVVFAGPAGGGSEVVTDGVSGFLVDPDGQVDSVVGRLRLMAADRSAYAEIGRAARQEVIRRFSLERFASEKLALYRSIRERLDAGQAPGKLRHGA